MDNKQLPSNELAEKGLIGAILFKPTQVMLWCQEAGLTEEHFNHGPHRVIYRHLCHMTQTLGPDRIDLINLATSLKKSKELESIGGEKYLHEAIDEMSSPASAPSYIDEICDKWLRRSGIETISELTTNLYDDPAPAEELITDALAHVIGLSNQAQEIHNEKYSHESSMENYRRAKEDGFFGMPSYLPGASRIIRSYYPGQLIILAGGPSEGKSTLAFGEAAAIAENIGPVAVQSLEMTVAQVCECLIFQRAGLDSRKFDFGTWSDAEMEMFDKAGKELDNLPIHINDRPSTFGQSAAYLTEMKAIHDIKFAVIDYLQLLRESKFTRTNKTTCDIIGEWTSGYKQLAKRLSMPIMVLSQFSRRGHKDQTNAPPLPMLEALRGSGSIEQDADLVITINKRPGIPMADFLHDEWPMTIDIPKNRLGPTGRKELVFQRNKKKFVTEENSFAVPFWAEKEEK